MYKYLLQLLIFTLLVSFQLDSLAVINKPIHFVVGVVRKHDDNIFREQRSTKSENITSLSAGLILDKKFGQQHLKGEATITRNDYNKNDRLSFTSKNYMAALDWSLTRRLTGTISIDRDQRLNDFNDTRNKQRNIRTLENQKFLADFNPNGGWHLLGGVSRQTLDNSETFNQDASYSANATDFGVKYLFPSGSSMKLMNHIRRGHFDDREISASRLFDDGYKEHETEAELDWLLTIKSRLLMNFSYIKRDHDNFSERDYSGFQTKLGYDWKPTEKINLNVSAKSLLNTFQSDTDSYTRKNELKIVPRYFISPKLSVLGELSASNRKFLGNGYNASSTNRVDNIKTGSLGMQWNPTLQSTVEFKVSHYNQDSNINTFDFIDNIASVSASISF